MGRIVFLDRNMINMIAAGEVIERPASVVKELLENSIDASATKITVSIEDGGRKLIAITDNGCGMEADDLAAAFEPHATSKIKNANDLQEISTLGFRGEALASIASVAQVKAVSRTAESLGGNCIEIDCGSGTPISPCSADYGTSIQVRDLFYKLPARRKFLKTANTEAGHITEYFKRIALANENLDMTLLHNGREVYRLGAGKGIVGRIAELFSTEISENLIETRSSEKGLEVFALMGKPGISRTNAKFQYVFINGRFIRDKFISHAVREAYRASMEQNRYPVIFLFIQMPPEDLDVNVHPTKIEVRFYNSNLVHSQILGCLREKLLATNLDVDVNLPKAQQRSQQVADAMADFFNKYKPVSTQQQLGFDKASYHKSGHTKNISERPFVNPIEEYSPGAFQQRRYLQIHNSFIVTEGESGFMIIDQHALHERIMYENLRKRISIGRLESQKLLIPESFQLTASQAQAVKANADLIKKLGIELTEFGLF